MLSEILCSMSCEVFLSGVRADIVYLDPPSNPVYRSQSGPPLVYRTDQFWRDFPIFHMSRLLKTYYLWQFSYWLQQTLLLAARVEKPRKDFKELVAHVSRVRASQS
jgi:hypothetical protein